MADIRFAWRSALWAGLLAAAAPRLCAASDVVSLFGTEGLVVVGAILAMPSAGLCFLAEAIAPRRRLPAWLTMVAALGAGGCSALALFGSGPTLPSHESFVFAWFLVPPLATLALRGAINDRLIRLALGWAVAFLVLGLVVLRHVSRDVWALIAGGTVPCLLLWTGVLLFLTLRRIAPDPIDFWERHAAIAAALKRLADAPLFRRGASLGERQLVRLEPARAGLLWWFASACVLYIGIGVAISAGKLGGGAWLYVEWQYVADFFGLRYPKDFRPAHLWWVVGLPWSLLGGAAFWGLAGLLGGFDPGRARAVRLAAIVFGGALLLWTASIISQIAETNEREVRASAIHR